MAALKKPGRHSDGGGLYLRITPAGARCWVFMSAAGGKRIEIGLGAENALGLAAARKIADQMREAVVLARNPRDVLQPAVPAKRSPTFGEYADAYIASVESGWKNPTHRQQWRNSLRDHAGSLADKHVDQINTEDILAVLRPIWMKTPETASRVRGRIERILDAAKAQGHIPKESSNPARFKGHLDHLLARQVGMSRGHHKALNYQQIAAFMAELRKRTAPAARCLELALENPPLLVVCDLERFVVHTNWTNSVSQVHELELEDLRDASKREMLKWVMSDPERLRPGTTREALTATQKITWVSVASGMRRVGRCGKTS